MVFAKLAPILQMPWVAQACRMLHENRTWKVFGVELLGINLPKSVIVRTRDEAIDVAFNEYGNTAGFFGGVWLGSKVADKLLAALKIAPNFNPEVISQWRVMKSFMLVPPLTAFMAAMPFARNAFTAWRAGTVDYKTLITKGKPQSHDSVAERQAVQDAIQGNLIKAAGIMAVGVGLALAGFFWGKGVGPFRMFQAGSSRLVNGLNTEGFKKAIKAVCLTGKNATEFGDLRAVAFWGIPCYLGWMAASRDKFEMKEQFLKMLNFIGVYLLTEKGVGWFFNKKTQDLQRQFPALYPKGVFSHAAFDRMKASVPGIAKVMQFENLKLLSGFGLTVVLMAALPAFLNIYLTRQRLARQEQESRARRAQPRVSVPQVTVARPRVSPAPQVPWAPMTYRSYYPVQPWPMVENWPYYGYARTW